MNIYFQKYNNDPNYAHVYYNQSGTFVIEKDNEFNLTKALDEELRNGLEPICKDSLEKANQLYAITIEG